MVAGKLETLISEEVPLDMLVYKMKSLGIVSENASTKDCLAKIITESMVN